MGTGPGAGPSDPRAAAAPRAGLEGLRLMHVVLSLDPGGTERLVIDMSKHLRERAEVRVCCLDEPGAWARELLDLEIGVDALHRQPGFRPSLAKRIAGLARAHRTNVLHCHHYTPFVYGALAATLRRGLRFVYTEHGRLSDAPPSRKRRLANFFLGRLPGHYVAVSHDLRRHMLAGGLLAERVEVIHNGIEAGARPGAAERAGARRRLDLASDALVIGTVTRFDPVKDLGLLIGAFAQVAAVRPDAMLVLIGDGPERRQLELLAARTGVGERIRFTGARDDARELLAALDVFANTSVTEGVSVTILEAMAAGLPVVATRVGGTPEVVLAEETGLLCPAGRAEPVARSLARLASDSGLRQALGAAGRARVEEAFALATMVRGYLRLYSGGPGRETVGDQEAT